MSKVLLPTLDYRPRTGGVARYLYAIKKTLGDDIDILFFDDNPGRLKTFWRIFRSFPGKEQVWVSHILPMGTYVWCLSLLSGKGMNYSVFLHGMDFDLARRSIWKRWLTRRVLKRATYIFANTHALSKEVEAFSRRNVEVIYPCVSDALVEASSVVRRDDHDGVVLLTVGRLVERKGHMDVLKIVRDNSNLRYAIVGDGVMRAEIEAYIEEYHFADRVELLQSIPDRKLPAIYARSDIFVMPTHKSETDREGFGIVYLEAQLFGTPVIAVSHPGVDEAVIDGIGGVLINDHDELELAIKRLAENRVMREDLGRRGQIFVREKFTREKQFGVLKAYV